MSDMSYVCAETSLCIYYNATELVVKTEVFDAFIQRICGYESFDIMNGFIKKRKFCSHARKLDLYNYHGWSKARIQRSFV